MGELLFGALVVSGTAEVAAIRGSSLAGVYGCDGMGGEARASIGRSCIRKGRSYYFFADGA